MSSAARHTFKTSDPVDRYSEQLRFYVQLRGKDYHPAMPIPRTTVSDCRQIAEQWAAALASALPTLKRGLATEWKGIVRIWKTEIDRLESSGQGPNETYQYNRQFWIGLRKLGSQLGALDQVVTRRDVLVWAVKDTVQSHAETVVDAGKAAAQAVTGVAGAVSTTAKALAAGAIGLGVYAIARRK